MMDGLAHYLQTWHLSDPQPLAETATSRLYTVRVDGQTAVLKLLTPMGIQDEHSGAVALDCFGGQGAVRLLRHDDRAHLLEYAPGPDLVPLVRNGADDEATIIAAGVLNQLHHAGNGTLPAGLHPLRRWFRALFQRAETDLDAGADTIYVRAVRLADDLLAHPQDECVLHGDIHHQNIRQSERGWLAFDPKGLRGERTYDAANWLCNPVDLPEVVGDKARLLRTAAILAEQIAVERPRLLAFVFVYACLSACWSLEDGGDTSLALTVASLVESYL